MSQRPSDGRGSAGDSVQDDVTRLLKDAETPAGKLRIMENERIPDAIKLVLLDTSTDQRARLEALLQTSNSVKEWALKLLTKPKDWEKNVHKRVKQEFYKGPDAFMSFLKICAKLDLTMLSLEQATHNGKLTATTDAFLAPLDLENAIVNTALDEFHKSKASVSKLPLLPSEHPVPNGEPWIDMSSAAIPKLSTRAERYGESVRRWLKKQSEDFAGLKNGFEELAREIFGDDKEVFLTKGTTGAFHALAAEFREITYNDSTAFLAATPGEYLPLFTPLRYKSFTAGIDSPDFTEQDVIDGVRAHIKEYTKTTDLVVTVSSVQRMGGKRMDIEKLCDDLRALQEELEPDTPRIHVWVDASQDTRVIRNADVVFYSKRTGSIVVIDKKRYPKDDLDDLCEAARMRFGYDGRQAAETVASLHSIRGGKRASLDDLIHEPNVWLPKESSIDQQIKDGQRYIAESPILSGTFRLVAPGPDPQSSDALLRLEAVHPGGVNMAELQRELRKRQIEVGSFSLTTVPAVDGETLTTLRTALGSPDLDAMDALERIRKFQNAHKDRIAWSLLPADPHHQFTKEQVLDHFEKSVQAHEFLRLHLNDLDSPQRLMMFLAQTEKALETLHQRNAQPRGSSDRKSHAARKRSRGSR